MIKEVFKNIFDRTDLIFIVSILIPLLFSFDLHAYSFLVQILLGVVMFFSIRPFFQGKTDFSKNKKHIIYAILFNYVLLSGVYLLTAWLLFSPNHPFFRGYVLLALVPPAVAIVPLCTLSKCDPQTADSAIFFSFIAGVLLLPVVLYLSYGKTISLFEVFKILFVLVIMPMLLAYFSKDSHSEIFSYTRAVNNLCLSLVIIISISLNRSVLLDITNPEILYVYLINIFVIFGLGFLVYYITSRYTARQHAIAFALYASHKNVGTSIALAIFLFDIQSAIPAIIALVLQFLFFIVFEKYLVKIHLKHQENIL